MSDVIEVVGFDLDDTLYEHRQYVTAGFEAVATKVEAETGVEIYDDLVTSYFKNKEYHGTFDIVLEAHDLSTAHVDELVDTYHDIVGELTVYPGVLSTLKILAESYELGVITAGKNTQRKLNELGLSRRFDFVVTTASREFSKLESKPFDKLLAHFDTKPAHTVYVGDDPRVDFRQPNLLGMYTVRVRQGTVASMAPPSSKSVPDYVITDINELPTLLYELER